MSSLPKLSLVILALGILSTPFFASAAWFSPDGVADSSFQILPMAKPSRILEKGGTNSIFRFSFKNLDSRIYARLQGQGEEITQTAQAGEGGPQYGDEWMTQVACNDGVDNDGDGRVDSRQWWNWVTYDPGCDAPLDDSEYGPKQCDDGRDNDGDGRTDYRPGGSLAIGDLGCESLTDDSELPPVAGAPNRGGMGGGSPESGGALHNSNVTLSNDFDFQGNAYETEPDILWETTDVCGCTSSPLGWWNGTEGVGIHNGLQAVTIDAPGSVTYNLVCSTQPSCNPSAGTVSDSVTITPDWTPRIDEFSGPAQVALGDRVNLIWKGNDLKLCYATGWDGPSLSALQVANDGLLGQNQSHSVDVGTISARKTYTLTCTGFNDVELLMREVTVDLITSPTPFFSINSINLIIIGPGSGGRSNKAIVGVTKSASFTGNITLTAAPALGSESLTNQGAELCLNATDGTTCSSSATILCTSSLSSTCDNTAEFWVETAGDLLPTDYTITLTADPQPPSTLASETKTIPLRVRRFIPAFQEI